MNTLKKSKNFKFIIIGLLICIAVYYFKDLSLALGKTNRVPLALASWIPVFSVKILVLLEYFKLMKNKFLIIVLFFYFQQVFADQINIKASKINIDKKNEITIFENNVVIKDEKNNIIESDYAEYDKVKKIIKLENNVKAIDINNNVLKVILLLMMKNKKLLLVMVILK